jgi:CRP/FNR family cyclic AMP-dependent transcriptional regulator
VPRLKDILIFRNLEKTEIEKISEICELVEYEDGEHIVTQDTLSSYLYVLLEGNVNILMKGREGKNIQVSEVQQGDVFGEAAIFMEVKRTASVVALGTVQIVSITRDKLISFTNIYPRAGVKIYLFIILSLLLKLKRVSTELVLEKESTVSAKDLERLKTFFPKALDDFF